MTTFNISKYLSEDINSLNSIDLTNIPILQKRRLPKIAKLCYAIIKNLDIDNTPIIFASQNAELQRTLNIIRSFNDEVSPTQFSLSVHNAIAGLLTIINKNKCVYTSIDSNSGIIETAIIDAVSMLLEYEKVIVIYFEDNQPHEYQSLEKNLHSMKALGVLIETGNKYSLTNQKNNYKQKDVESNLLNIEKWLNGNKSDKLITAYNRLQWEWSFND